MADENWVKEETPKNIRNSAQAILDKVKEQRRGKKFKYVRVDSRTVKEVEVK